MVVLAGAGLGGVMRYTLGTWIMAKYGGRFPLGTFLINVVGS
jgi:CrcB protein